MDADISIRRIQPHAHASATRVWQSSWESAGVGHPNDLSYAALLKKFREELATSWDLYVADHEGKIIGLLALKPSQNQIDQLFIAPEYQRRGIGKLLLNFAKNRLPNEIWLRTAEQNKRAIAFYALAGFEIDRVEARPEWDRNDIVIVWRAA